MRRMAAALGAVALLVLTATLPPPAHAAPTIKVYANCKQLLKDFPHGLARDVEASFAMYATGWYRPRIVKRTYAANRRLDVNHNGVLCEQRP
jgi:hypothetical protein